MDALEKLKKQLNDKIDGAIRTGADGIWIDAYEEMLEMIEELEAEEKLSKE